jgi:hypothetical protein
MVGTEPVFHNLGTGEIQCLKALAAHNVRYLVVGGYAVRFYGYLRKATDLDVLTGNTNDDAIRLCAALEQIMGFENPKVQPDKIVNQARKIPLQNFGHEFDILTAADGVDFDAAYERKSISVVDGDEIAVIAYGDLIAMKKASGRPIDIDDIRHLEAIKDLREKLGELKRAHKLHFEAIENIRADFDHSIELVEPSSLPGPTNFNCVMYALNLKDDPLVIALALSDDIVRAVPSRRGERYILADTEFLDFCLANGSMPSISDRTTRPGDLLVYMNNGRCRHIGRVVERGRIQSKLGTFDLLEHHAHEMPDCYGDDLFYVESLTHEQSRDLFIEYAWSVVEDNPRTKLLLDSTINKHR